MTRQNTNQTKQNFQNVSENGVGLAADVFQQTTHAASSTGLTSLQFLYPHPSTP
jgi:hypothetical protein